MKFDEYKVSVCETKLIKAKDQEAELKLLYQWTKTGHISFSDFKELLFRRCFEQNFEIKEVE